LLIFDGLAKNIGSSGPAHVENLYEVASAKAEPLMQIMQVKTNMYLLNLIIKKGA
jgi:hypothetical protein